MKAKIFKISLLVLALLVISMLALPAMAQNVPCYFDQGGAKFVAVVFRSTACEWEMQTGTTLDIQSGVTETHANDPTFTGSPTFSGVLTFTGASSFDTVDIAGALTSATGALTITDDVDIDGNLTSATGALTITDDVDIDGNLTSATGALTVTDSVNITGNLKVGNGTPTFSQDGEDAYIEGELELASELIFGAQVTYVVAIGEPITPTGTYLPMSAPALGVNVTDVVTPTSDTNGSIIVLHNIDSTDVITIDGTGKIVSCKADIVLAPEDTLTMLWTGANWNCLAYYDNS